MATRNITLTIPEELRRAKILAAQRGTSVSGLVARLLEQLVGDASDYDDVATQERRLMKAGIGLRVGEIISSRDELHER